MGLKEEKMKQEGTIVIAMDVVWRDVIIDMVH